MTVQRKGMLHHVDIHVTELEPIGSLFEGLAETIRYRRRSADEEMLSFEPTEGGRPRIGFLREDGLTGGSMRLAFGVDSREAVDRAGAVVREQNGRAIDGPALHPEYGDDYYAVFFEDPDGNRYEIVADPDALRQQPRVARLWRSRVRPGLLRAYRRYINATGIPDYRRTEGNCGAWILSAQHEGHDDVMTLSFWDSRASIVDFAGEDIDRAQYYPEDQKYLLDFPERVEHFHID